MELPSAAPDDVRYRVIQISNGSVSETHDTIRSLQKTKFSTFNVILKEFRFLIADNQARKIIAFGIFGLLCFNILILWCNSTNSMALRAFADLIVFDLLGLTWCLLRIWINGQTPSSSFTFGYGRFEVLAIFSSTILAQLASLFIVKESFSRLIQQPHIHSGRLLLGSSLVFVCHVLLTYGQKNEAFDHVVESSSSSWLQEHVAEVSQSLCHVVPGLSNLLLPRINPLTLILFFGTVLLFTTHVVIEMNQFYAMDTVAAFLIAVTTCITMFPMSLYTGNILLQTMPSHVVGQLDKCLREALTLDGVLEFRKERFWTLSFGKLAGSLHVRVRRDADEQLVLAHLLDRLSRHLSVVAIQVFKDDWTRSTTLQILSDTDLAKMNFSSSKPPGNVGNYSTNNLESSAITTGDSVPFRGSNESVGEIRISI